MIKKYENYRSLIEMNLQRGDKIVVKYKDSKYFMRIGSVLNIDNSGPNKGDCFISMDYSNEYITLYYTNIEKVIELIEIPSGEVLYILEVDAMELAMIGLINKKRDFYYFEEQDRWQIESYAI